MPAIAAKHSHPLPLVVGCTGTKKLAELARAQPPKLSSIYLLQNNT